MSIQVTVLGLPQGARKLDELRQNLRCHLALIDGLPLKQEQIDVFFAADLEAQTSARGILITAYCRMKRLKAGQIEDIATTIGQVVAEYAAAWLPNCRQFTVWPVSSGDNNHVMTVNLGGGLSADGRKIW